MNDKVERGKGNSDFYKIGGKWVHLVSATQQGRNVLFVDGVLYGDDMTVDEYIQEQLKKREED